VPDDRFRQLKDAFDEAHQQGMDGLATGDYDALRNAIARERELIRKQAEIIAEHKDAIADERPAPPEEDGGEQT
jgi:hypothetical protein